MRPSVLALLAVTLGLVAEAASAQTLGRPPVPGPSVSFDALLAIGDDELAATTVSSPDDPTTIGTTSAAFVLSGRVPGGERWTVVAEVPLGYNRLDVPEELDVPGGDGYTTSDVSVGNPYLGAELRLRSDVTVEGGVRLPLASVREFDPRVTTFQADGVFGGLSADVERFEAYLDRTAALGVAVRYTPRLTPALGLRLRLAPTLVASTDSERDGRADLGIGYGVHADLRRGPLAASVGATGRQFAGDIFDGYGFFEVDLALALAASVDVGGVRPGLVARVPLTDEALSGAATVGLSLDVPVR